MSFLDALGLVVGQFVRNQVLLVAFVSLLGYGFAQWIWSAKPRVPIYLLPLILAAVAACAFLLLHATAEVMVKADSTPAVALDDPAILSKPVSDATVAYARALFQDALPATVPYLQGLLTVVALLVGITIGFTLVVVNTLSATFTVHLGRAAVRSGLLWWFLGCSLACIVSALLGLAIPSVAEFEVILPSVAAVLAVILLGSYLFTVDRELDPGRLVERLVRSVTPHPTLQPSVGFATAMQKVVSGVLTTIWKAQAQYDFAVVTSVHDGMTRGCQAYENALFAIPDRNIKRQMRAMPPHEINAQSHPAAVFESFGAILKTPEAAPDGFRVAGALLTRPVVWEVVLAARVAVLGNTLVSDHALRQLIPAALGVLDGAASGAVAGGATGSESLERRLAMLCGVMEVVESSIRTVRTRYLVAQTNSRFAWLVDRVATRALKIGIVRRMLAVTERNDEIDPWSLLATHLDQTVADIALLLLDYSRALAEHALHEFDPLEVIAANQPSVSESARGYLGLIEGCHNRVQSYLNGNLVKRLNATLELYEKYRQEVDIWIVVLNRLKSVLNRLEPLRRAVNVVIPTATVFPNFLVTLFGFTDLLTEDECEETRRQVKAAIGASMRSLARLRGGRAAEAETIQQLAGDLENQGEFDLARVFYAEGLALARDRGDQAGELVTLFRLGFVLSQQRLLDEALDSYMSAFTLARKVGDQTGEADALYVAAMLQSDRGAVQEAAVLLEQLIGLDHDLGRPDSLQMHRTMLDEIRAMPVPPS